MQLPIMACRKFHVLYGLGHARNGLEKRILRHWSTVQCIRNSSRDVAPRLCSAANNSALQNRMVMKKNRCPKTSTATIHRLENSAKVATTRELRSMEAKARELVRAEVGSSLGLGLAKLGELAKISKNFQIFGGLVLGCIKTKFCKKICV